MGYKELGPSPQGLHPAGTAPVRWPGDWSPPAPVNAAARSAAPTSPPPWFVPPSQQPGCFPSLPLSQGRGLGADAGAYYGSPAPSRYVASPPSAPTINDIYRRIYTAPTTPPSMVAMLDEHFATSPSGSPLLGGTGVAFMSPDDLTSVLSGKTPASFFGAGGGGPGGIFGGIPFFGGGGGFFDFGGIF